MSVCVNIGCGQTPTDGWRNFDNSPALKLAKSPVKLAIVKAVGLLTKEQIENVEWNRTHSIDFADATKELPLSTNSVSCLYTSHMFEHLSREDGVKFLKESFRVLEVGGVIRVSVPDLSKAVDFYRASGDANQFMETIYVTAPKLDTWQQKLRLLFAGYRHHQWMYDGESLSKLMADIGFYDVSIMQPGSTMMINATSLDLFERSRDSVYVEGKK
ncbi:MAG: hypothetical protein CMM15_11475 [Rhodospirillaceae bacterium]|nr:hypothetical protein [Rhodospirillaceae bacterium]